MKRWHWVAVSVVLATVLTLIIWRATDQPDPVPEDGMQSDTRAAVERLDQTDTTHQRVLREALATASREHQRRLSAEKAAQLARDSARVFASMAEAEENDSTRADYWRSAYEHEKVRGDSLQVALEAESRARKVIYSAFDSVRARSREEAEARDLMRRDLRDMAERLAKAERRTKHAFVAGTVVGGVLGSYVTKEAIEAAKDG